MKITLAESAGFCFGVNRAVNMVYDLVNKGNKVCTLGPIIHNRFLVDDLEKLGVFSVDSVQAAPKDHTLVIRSHGVGQDIYNKASELNIKIEDATCPFVAKIHKIAREQSALDYPVLIGGDPKHSEVIGIKGHCSGEAYVFSDIEQLEQLLKNHPEFKEKDVAVVSQTTFNAKIFEECKIFLKKVCTNANIFDTICNATALRQQQAMSLAKENDMMIVVGGLNSSNTAKLFDVCSEHCDTVVLVETAADLPQKVPAGVENIGVVAGASTPAGIIKEVIRTMSEIMQPVEEQLEEKEVAQKSFDEMTDEEAFEASINSLNSDQKVVGVVLSVNPSEIQVDIGRGLAGYVTAEEYSSDPSVNMMEEVKPGDELNLIIMRTNDQEGTAMLSKRRFDAIAGWSDIVAAKDSGEILTGIVSDVVKGGVVTSCKGVRIFIPASQATLSRNDSLDELKGKEVSFRIIEIGRGRRAIGSIRSVLREQRKEAEEKIWANIAEGDKITGVVKSLTSYGAFVDIGGVDGMIHISELSWTRIKNPSEVVAVGDTVDVYIKAIDKDKKKISLGYKKADENPWTIFKTNYGIDSVVTVTIVSLTTYGAFAKIIPGVDGLIHISQIANKHVAKTQDELSVGQEVEAKIINIDDEQKRVSLSIRALLPEEAPAEEVAEEATEAPVEAPVEEAPAEEAAE
ncbi:MAG: bifunctional 4-hydroxy-3-methylbut-2-enyl diphosphate reductase/30S ribosomal protein S1 [Clostridia bacterium]|nr:bifunctional 4-hydroxy-3-methylbut-2-enyl diphosphate reductase/30S ribosomal protein S1 [Clostridia bacterium]